MLNAYKIYKNKCFLGIIYSGNREGAEKKAYKKYGFQEVTIEYIK